MMQRRLHRARGRTSYFSIRSYFFYRMPMECEYLVWFYVCVRHIRSDERSHSRKNLIEVSIIFQIPKMDLHSRTSIRSIAVVHIHVCKPVGELITTQSSVGNNRTSLLSLQRTITTPFALNAEWKHHSFTIKINYTRWMFTDE